MKTKVTYAEAMHIIQEALAELDADGFADAFNLIVWGKLEVNEEEEDYGEHFWYDNPLEELIRKQEI